jgi:type II secretory pathway pseudopilin PulG
MAALLVTLSIMTIMMSVALPIYSTMAKRERETELVFRGQQYARAVSLFQRKYGNALPPNVDVLIDQKFLRKKYKDPITGDDFEVVGPGSPALANALNAAPELGQPQGGRQGQQLGGRQGQQPQGQQPQGRGRGALSSFGMNQQSAFGTQAAAPGQAPGGVLGVMSKSTETSLRLYNGHDKYNEWVFVATQMSVAAGRGGRGGEAGGPGGRAGRGQNQPPDGRGGGRGPFGRPQGGFPAPQQPFGGNRGGTPPTRFGGPQPF